VPPIAEIKIRRHCQLMVEFNHVGKFGNDEQKRLLLGTCGEYTITSSFLANNKSNPIILKRAKIIEGKLVTYNTGCEANKDTYEPATIFFLKFNY
jgi:hypothetical protein